MNKFTNPFHTINEAIAKLNAHGANPLQLGATIPDLAPEDKPKWPDNVLRVEAERVYTNDGGHYFRFLMHLNSTGFEEIVKLIEMPVTEEIIDAPGDLRFLSIEPSPLLKIYTLTGRRTL